MLMVRVGRRGAAGGLAIFQKSLMCLSGTAYHSKLSRGGSLPDRLIFCCPRAELNTADYYGILDHSKIVFR